MVQLGVLTFVPWCRVQLGVRCCLECPTCGSWCTPKTTTSPTPLDPSQPQPSLSLPRAPPTPPPPSRPGPHPLGHRALHALPTGPLHRRRRPPARDHQISDRGAGPCCLGHVQGAYRLERSLCDLEASRRRPTLLREHNSRGVFGSLAHVWNACAPSASLLSSPPSAGLPECDKTCVVTRHLIAGDGRGW